MTPAPSTDDTSTPRGPRWPRLILVTLLAVIGVAGFAWLGTWQVQRLHWKTDLIERVEARIHAAPVAAPGPEAWAGISREGDEYTRVTLSGSYDHGDTALVYTPSDYGPGYWVLTPLRRDDGTVVLVNRGVVPEDRALSGDYSHPKGPVTVTGLLRISEDEGWLFSQDNDPQAGRWYRRDIGAITQALGLARAAPYFVDAEAGAEAQAWPRAGKTVVAFRNSHLSYALTWFALMALVLGGYALVLRAELRRG
ncbi:SURF1 family protein [Pseudooceanicola sp. 200-1SW]|uniref:SURF1 family protein n=1 Tax=Pseudooceanicola sp. 200-1SW TaxID=3425949 RepID=UPI003D7F6961